MNRYLSQNAGDLGKKCLPWIRQRQIYHCDVGYCLFILFEFAVVLIMHN